MHSQDSAAAVAAAPAIDVWAALAAPLPPTAIRWRQDGKPFNRSGAWYARFIAFISAATVQDRLDEIARGEWDMQIEPISGAPDSEGRVYAKCRLTVLGVAREDVGCGRDHKAAATDAFKRAAARFGIGRELQELGQNIVEMDGDGKYAKPVLPPDQSYLKFKGRADVFGEPREPAPNKPYVSPRDEAPTPRADASYSDGAPPCPKCGGRMWDNRIGKRNPKAPDFKCRDRGCDGVIWPPKDQPRKPASAPDDAGGGGGGYDDGDDDLPF